MEDANAFPRISDSSNNQSSHMDSTSRCPPGISTRNDLNLEAAIALASFADATVSSVPSEPKDIRNLEKARHRNVLYRRRMHFEKQITKMNGVNKFSEKEILVWCGTIKNGVWRKATQLSCVGEVVECIMGSPPDRTRLLNNHLLGENIPLFVGQNRPHTTLQRALLRTS